MNGTLTGARATARVAATIHDNLVMPPATGNAKGATRDTCGRPGSPFNETTDTPALQDLFATAPMKAMWREFDWQRAEEAHTSFEAAISNRVLALKERHVSAYMGTGARGSVTFATNRFVNIVVSFWHKGHSARVWRRSLLLVGTALMLILAGFDLMGLLVLNAR